MKTLSSTKGVNRGSLINRIDERYFGMVNPETKLNKMVKLVEELPQVMTLYRIVGVNELSELDIVNIGIHFALDKDKLVNRYNFLKNKKYVLFTVKVDKKHMDIQTTLENRIDYPSENEITLKKTVKFVGFETSIL